MLKSRDKTVNGIRPPSRFGVADWRVVAAVLALGTFAVGTDAFVIAGLLPDIATSLHVTVGAAGQLVTVFAIAYAVAAVPLGLLASRWLPRTALLGALLLLAVGNVLSAVAPGYALVLAARVVAAAGAAVYTATATATASTVAGPGRQGRAIAIVMFGATASLVLGAPLGSALGAAFGWRSTLWAVAGLALLGGLAIAAQLSHDTTAQPVELGRVRALVTDRRVTGLLARSFVAFLAIDLPYTYISAVFEPVTVHGVALPWLLVTFGVTASMGNIVAGRLADRHGPHRVVVAVLLLLAAGFAFVPLAREMPSTGVIIVAITGWLSFSYITPQQHILISLAPNAIRQVSAFYQAVIYAAISASGALGAALLAEWGGAAIVVVAASLAAVAAALSWWAGRTRS